MSLSGLRCLKKGAGLNNLQPSVLFTNDPVETHPTEKSFSNTCVLFGRLQHTLTANTHLHPELPAEFFGEEQLADLWGEGGGGGQRSWVGGGCECLRWWQRDKRSYWNSGLHKTREGGSAEVSGWPWWPHGNHEGFLHGGGVFLFFCFLSEKRFQFNFKRSVYSINP